MRALGIFVVVLVVGLVVAGCSSTPEAKPAQQPTVQTSSNWWDNPGEITDALCSVGAAPVNSGLAVGAARSHAEVDGRQKIAAALKAKIQSLGTTWSKSTGDASDASTIQELFNNESFTRQIVDNTLVGARAVKYKTPDQFPGTIYCLIALDAEKYASAVKSGAADALKKVRTEVMTQVRKDECEKKLDALLDKEQAQIKAQEDAYMTKHGLPATQPVQ